MKTIKKIIYPLLVFAALLSCETEHILYDSSKNHVAFVQGSISMTENGGMVGIPVMVSALIGDPAVTVQFMVDEVQSVAVSGTDYHILNDPLTLSFSNGWGYDTIWVEPVDNDEFGGNITFVLKLVSNSLNYQFGAQDSIICTIIDDEHPLGTWIGTYDVEAVSYGRPGAWDESWSGVTTSPDPGDVTKLVIRGIAGSTIPFKATVDLDEMTITIPAGTNIGNVYGYGNVELWVGDENLNLDKTKDMVGTVSEDGSIHIDFFGEELADGPYAGYVWDVFDTYWTKVAKSSPSNNQQVPDKLRR